MTKPRPRGSGQGLGRVREAIRIFPLIVALAALAETSAFFATAKPAEDKNASPAPPRGRLRGRVYVGSPDSPFAGAQVEATQLETGKVFSSEPTKAGGDFEIRELPAGYYQFGVRVGGDTRAVEGVLDFAPGEAKTLSFRLQPGEAGSGETNAGSSPPVAQTAPVAVGFERPTPFFRTKAGVATLVGGAALLLFVVL